MKSEGMFQFGEFQIDVLARTLRREEEIVMLNRRAFDVLLYLAQNPGRVLTRDELLKNVWPETFVDENSLAQSISALRRALEEKPGDNSYIVTLPGRGYQFVAPVQVVDSGNGNRLPEVATSASNISAGLLLQQQTIRTSVITEEKEQLSLPVSRNRALKRLVAALVTAVILTVSVAVVGGIWYWRSHQGRRLTEQSSIVIADFANSTGDPVFDGSLRQGLSSQLEQSPFLNLLSDRRIAQTLSLMSQPKDARLTRELAQQVCQRTGSAAVLDGTIAQVGTRYLLTLKTINCANGESLASAGAQAADKNHVLDALGKVASEIRGKLGESLVSVQKYDSPPENVTTPSLEALQAYSLGYRAWFIRNDGPSAIPLFQRAIDLDPNFAMAYARLGTLYFNGGESARGTDALQRAYELRERVSEREKFYISAHRADIVDGDLEAARKVYELWAQLYPRDFSPLESLGVIYELLGDYESAPAVYQKALKLSPGDSGAFNNAAGNSLHRNRLDEVEAAAREAQAQHLDFPTLHANLYLVNFLHQDAAAMEREAAWLMGKPGWENFVLYMQSDTAAYGGHFAQARELTWRAIGSAQRADRKETAAAYDAEAALREALVGNLSAAKQQAGAALALSKNTDVEGLSAVALGLAGDPSQAWLLADEIGKAFPKGTVVQRSFLPTIGAAAVIRHDPRKAISLLAVSAPYELGQATVVSFCLYGVYLRGEAYLATNQGSAAAAEFQRILDHPGLVTNEPIGALAHLGLGRAYILMEDKSKGKSAYQDFLTLWKDADPDIPVLKEAKAEYAKLTAQTR
jgi:DNA-binding winged helix-turn-helix (wHTH) protein